MLIAATDKSRADHADALAAINTWPSAGVVLYTSGQTLREYLAVATRPVKHNGLGSRARASRFTMPTSSRPMLVHGVDTVVTLNLDDFAGFGDQVRILDLRS